MQWQPYLTDCDLGFSVMDFQRTRDLSHVYKVLTCPSIYLMMGDDFLPPIEEYHVPDNPDIVWLIAGDKALVGLFALFPQNRICWELHAALLPWASKAEKRAAGRGLVPWLAANSECRRLTASIPECNRPALFYGTQFLGMHYVGRQQKAFLRYGRLQDLILLGREVGRGYLPGTGIQPEAPHHAEKHAVLAERVKV